MSVSFSRIFASTPAAVSFMSTPRYSASAFVTAVNPAFD